LDRAERETDCYYKALGIAENAHAGQLDKGGSPYINHPLAVAAMVEGDTEKVVAILHDVVEDGGVLLDSLQQFGLDVVNAVDAITRREGELRGDYLSRVAANPLAKAVKIADLRHNSDLSRIAAPTGRDIVRAKRYQDEIDLLG
jgi:(p)ppGpp synthase/HD superfamily hydrolase